MPKYKTGDYMVIVFDRYGTALKKEDALWLGHGHEVAKYLMKTPEAFSYVIIRTIFNSLDHYDRYLPRESDQTDPQHQAQVPVLHPPRDPGCVGYVPDSDTDRTPDSGTIVDSVVGNDHTEDPTCT